MIARLTLAATALLAVAPALAQKPQPVPQITAPARPQIAEYSAISCQGPGCRVAPETRIRQMSEYLEAVADPGRGVFIRGYTGQWYYASVRGECPRLHRGAQLRFNSSPGNVFDRDSTIRADGWRCRIDSVTQSDGPPRRH